MMKFRAIFIFSCIAFTFAGTALAGPTTITPFVQARQEYSDNILFTEDNEASDAITILTSGLRFAKKTSRLSSAVTGQLDKRLYWDYSELNDLDYGVSGTWDYRVTERLDARASAGYAQDSSRDRDTETTGLLVSGDRKTAEAGLGSGYALSEVLEADLDFQYKRVERDEENDLEDNDSFSMTLSFTRNLSGTFRNTSGILNINYLHYTADSETTSPGTNLDTTTFQDYDTDIIQVSAGAIRNLTELYQVSLMVGASYSATSEASWFRRTNNAGNVVAQSAVTESDSDTFGGVFSAGVQYRDEYYTISLSADQSMRGGTGTSGAVQRSSLSGGVDRKVSDRFFLTLDASCYLNR
ncbi:MAG: hypothetical protein MI802_04005, partial [Desulfobacterales bacterium]|nr:hypothetical protein [Desulfobacterales bacterium]